LNESRILVTMNSNGTIMVDSMESRGVISCDGLIWTTNIQILRRQRRITGKGDETSLGKERIAIVPGGDVISSL